MAGDTIITVVGNLTADPELRFTPSGAAVANFTVASTPRNFDRQSGEWKDGEALFLRCNIWREAAENVAESLTRGSRVVVTGRLKQRAEHFQRRRLARPVRAQEADDLALAHHEVNAPHRFDQLALGAARLECPLETLGLDDWQSLHLRLDVRESLLSG